MLDDVCVFFVVLLFLYGMMIKVVVGGGGCGMCVVYDVQVIVDVYVCCVFEVIVVGGGGDVYVEVLVFLLCYIEIQIVVDVYGYVVYFGECECSLQ